MSSMEDDMDLDLDILEDLHSLMSISSPFSIPTFDSFEEKLVEEEGEHFHLRSDTEPNRSIQHLKKIHQPRKIMDNRESTYTVSKEEQLVLSSCPSTSQASWNYQLYQSQQYKDNWIINQRSQFKCNNGCCYTGEIPINNTINRQNQRRIFEYSNYPTGIEVLLRQISEECRWLLDPSDVPDSAKARGYFTVAELLHLKRIVIARFNGEPTEKYNEQASLDPVPQLRRGIKRRYANKDINTKSEKVSVIRSTNSIEGVYGLVTEAMNVLHDQSDDTPGNI